MEDPRTSQEIRAEIEEQMNEAIRLTMMSTGLEIDDQEAINQVKLALKKKLEDIISTVAFHAGTPETQKGVLKMKHLKMALDERNYRVDRPDFILEQQQSQQKSMSTRRAKTK